MDEMVLKSLLIYAFPALLVWGWYAARRKTLESRSLDIKSQELEAGLTEPSSLHPIIDPVYCVGCKACVEACPENNVLGMVKGKAELIAPTHCIGHGACRTACPMDAIKDAAKKVESKI